MGQAGTGEVPYGEHCYYTQSGNCWAWRIGGDCRCDYGYVRGGDEYGGEVRGQCYRPPT
jgi:hypothetical protein